MPVAATIRAAYPARVPQAASIGLALPYMLGAPDTPFRMASGASIVERYSVHDYFD